MIGCALHLIVSLLSTIMFLSSPCPSFLLPSIPHLFRSLICSPPSILSLVLPSSFPFLAPSYLIPFPNALLSLFLVLCTSPCSAAVVPEFARNAVVSMLQGDTLRDLSISRPRTRLTWGIPVPGDSSQTVMMSSVCRIICYSMLQLNVTTHSTQVLLSVTQCYTPRSMFGWMPSPTI